MIKSEINKCAHCGKFRKWSDLASAAGDSNDVGEYDEWFVCRLCCPFDFRKGEG